MNEFFLVYFGVFILGLLLGSYLNSWMWRVHEGKWILGGRSVCIHCNRQLNWYENVPLVSFVWLRGICRTCHESIPMDYFLVELCTAFLLVWLVYYHGTGAPTEYWYFLRDVFFVALLIVTFVYDAKYSLVLSGVISAGAVVGLWFNIVKFGFTWESLSLGMAIGGGFFLLQYLVSRGRWVGGGDIRIGLMMGAWLGWPQILVALFFSYIIGATVAIPLLIFKRKNFKSEIPFGTFLAVGTFISLFWGTQILSGYIKMIGW
jgi:prepilin signal peptidase PulO-like enzyme (type II secretory pathway)